MTTPLQTSPANGKQAILMAICLAALVLPMSFTGGSVATPFIGRTFDATPQDLAWITNAFMLSFGSLLMASGTLADRYGRKRLFTWGMSLFMVVSVLLASVQNIFWLDTLRAAQGVAAAAALSSGTAALAQEFEGHARTRAFSLLGTTFGVGLAFGPLLSGVLIEHLGWRAIFLSTALIAGLSLIFAIPRMRESRSDHEHGLDVTGLLTFSGMLVAFTIAVILAPEQGWSDPITLCLLAIAATFLLLFIVVENRASAPVLDLALFRFPRFIGVQILPIGTCYCYIVLIVLLPFRFIGVEGSSASEAGLIMMALSGPMLVVPLIAAFLTRWFSAGLLCGIGFLIAAAGLYWLSTEMVGNRFQIIAAMLLIGIGTGLPWGLMDGLAISVVPKERAGMAAGIFNTTRVASEGVALAITLAVLAALIAHQLGDRVSHSLTPGECRSIAQRLVMGDMAHAVTSVEQVSVGVLRACYLAGFNTLLQILSVFSVFSAAAALMFLGRLGSTNPKAQPITERGSHSPN
ncbi:MFS transporter [Pseudomonas sp. H3(2019)]|uniref:MFS transporter n=1 Tax=Pseudomonas sp. H3(2019) TaxID=2598724 RepID=UPI0011931B7C|nr:MFS transporter [Pseudomonas sp. H3(2019)]TVT80973.1 MFS transporter [Pseudomonas sp. H3(2019)]